MKKLLYLFCMLFGMTLMISNSSCESTDDSSNKLLSGQQEAIMQEANRQVGMANIVNFQERKLMKQILELRDQENLVCYAYIVAEMNGKLIYLGKCIGYGLPYATQYTNPEKYVDDPNGSYEVGSVVIPQADPNGLFMPTSAEGTWIMLLDSLNTPRPVYIEPKVIVSPFKLNI